MDRGNPQYFEDAAMQNGAAYNASIGAQNGTVGETVQCAIWGNIDSAENNVKSTAKRARAKLSSQANLQDNYTSLPRACCSVKSSTSNTHQSARNGTFGGELNGGTTRKVTADVVGRVTGETVTRAVILAGGFGTRFLPFTKAVPKPMLPIIDTPAIEFVVREALESGIEEILIVIGANGDVIKRHFSPIINKTPSAKPPCKTHKIPAKTAPTNTKNPNQTGRLPDYSKLPPNLLEKTLFSERVNVHFARQKTIDGTASAILCARAFVQNSPFLIMNADELFVPVAPFFEPASKQLIRAFNTLNKCIIGTQRVKKSDASKLGVCEGVPTNDATLILRKIKEKPNVCDITDPLVNLGRYVVKPDIFAYLESVLPNRAHETALTDALVDYSNKNEDVICCNFVAKRYDIGNKDSYKQAVFDFSMQDEAFAAYARQKLGKK